MSRGKYIVIEGNDGTGKSTQVKLLREYLSSKGIESSEYQEPSGTPIAGAIREVIINGMLERSGATNLLLFTAARHEIWKQAEKDLEEGKWVVCSRNYFSTLAYQGYGEGLDLDLITRLTAEFTSESYMKPDLAIILTLDHDTRASRIAERGSVKNPDTFESRTGVFQERVSNGYLEIAKSQQLPILDAAKSPNEIAAEIQTEYISKILP
ncbi:MAG TPA: dTMP kinase [Candidatus Saccharimonadales bacterium]